MLKWWLGRAGRLHVAPRPDRALRQMQGLPSEAFDMLVRTLARICDDPYDPVFSAPVPPVPGRRVADLGNFGFIEFIADETKGLIRVYHLVWTR